MQLGSYFDIPPLERAPCSVMRISDPDDPAIKTGARCNLFVAVHSGCTNLPVQPGCTNVGLSTLLQSRTNTDDDGCIGGSQARVKTECKWSMAGVCAHTDTRRT